MINLKRIFIPLFLFFTINPVYSMDQKIQEIENELESIIGLNGFKARYWLGSYIVEIIVSDSSALKNFLFHFDQKEQYLFDSLVVQGNIGNDGAQALARSLETDKGLRHLQLYNCGITDAGDLAVAIHGQMNKDKNNFIKTLSFVKDLKFSNDLEFEYDLAFIDALTDSKEKLQAEEVMCKVYMLKCLHDLGYDGNLEEAGKLNFQKLHETFMNFLENQFNKKVLFSVLFKSKGNYLQSLKLSGSQITDQGVEKFLKVINENLFFNFVLDKLDEKAISCETHRKFSEATWGRFFQLTCDWRKTGFWSQLMEQIMGQNRNRIYRLTRLHIENGNNKTKHSFQTRTI